eukprot:TRINITY_DN2043_c0_g1_i1.p1 TRINITY_DN2043_c0_g1~~TRINITY_DN2043_c0_g1_i1.p1  ORF type:complete len:424 (-),score=84.25 TRINITY_DN2043_c0_g1_i1:302-1573(-)
MGNSQAHSLDPEFEAARRKFSAAELGELKALFVSLASQSRSNGQFTIDSVFQAYFGIHGALGARLFDLVTRRRKDEQLTFEDLVISKSIYEKGFEQEIEKFIFHLVDLSGDGIVQRSELESVMISVFETILSPNDAVRGDTLSECSIQNFLNALKPNTSDCKDDQNISFEDFQQWCSMVPSLKKFLKSLLTPPKPGIPGRHIPHLLFPDNIAPALLIMRKVYAWHLVGALQQEESEKWILLYHSSIHGLSFNTFMANVIGGSGPSILLIKDKEGFIYGGYASQPWARHSSFYGDMKSFLFALSPAATIYRATGANANMQWCAINFASESIPNGLGFGGQINHFGLFLSESFDKGHSYSSVTYKNPCLSRSSVIIPDVIECWGIVLGESSQETEKTNVSKGTVLERFKEERNMLNMVGIANASD